MKKAKQLNEQPFAWKKYPENKPSGNGIYVVMTYKKCDYLEMDDYSSYPSKSKRAFLLNDNKSIMWARWAYKEELIDMRDDLLIYKKIYMFFDMEDRELSDVTHYIGLPLFLEGINENKSP